MLEHHFFAGFVLSYFCSCSGKVGVILDEFLNLRRASIDMACPAHHLLGVCMGCAMVQARSNPLRFVVAFALMRPKGLSESCAGSELCTLDLNGARNSVMWRAIAFLLVFAASAVPKAIVVMQVLRLADPALITG
ncbi:MAG: hypothetical protein V4674_00665 [Patescibacteria group bacterium]